ncbi:MAG: RagB/SusD family nutrient uptake outer membrane protein [Prevotellaceae bacterium]|nr:RagB/SusD family nutrient uptake outer membrane protein [Prevotellaceae bacterium]
MKKFVLLIAIALTAGTMTFTACSDDFLTSTNAGSSRTVDEPADANTLLGFAAAAYQPLLLDNYAPVRSTGGDGKFHSTVLTADLRSDDIYRGGSSIGDIPELWRLFTFTSEPTQTLNGLWSVCYLGLARSNQLIHACANTLNVSPEEQKRFNAEAHFLRAYYTHLLWKNWGNVPYFTEALEEPFVAQQYSADEIYQFIIADLQVACAPDALPMKNDAENIARTSLAAALMLKARVVLYQKDAERYPEITNDMATIIAGGQYSLMTDFEEIWRDSGEFCAESIFEANHLPKGKDWYGQQGLNGIFGGFGTALPTVISPDEPKPANSELDNVRGWGFAPVRSYAYESLYEPNDARRDGSINRWATGTYKASFQNTGYFLAKYAARRSYGNTGSTPLNFPNNVRIFRYAETLLNYAELVKKHGQGEVQGVTAQQAFDKIRNRAFNKSPPAPAQELTEATVELERRREFLGEGMRFWDLVRWGKATDVLTETVNIPGTDISYERTFTEAKRHLPIPQSEIDKVRGTIHELKQNEQ